MYICNSYFFYLLHHTQDNLDELLRQLIVLVSSPDNNIATCSAGVLSNLTCNNAKNKV